MPPQKRLLGIVIVLLIGIAAHGARPTAAQDGTQASTPATPLCAGTGAEPTVQVVLTIDEIPGQTISGEIVDRTATVLTRRAASISPDGCEVMVQADGSIRVSLAATPTLDADTAVRTLTRPARLEVVATGSTVPAVGATIAGPGDATPGATPGAAQYSVILTGSDIADAYAVEDATGGHQVGVTLTEDAAVRFALYTAEHLGEPLALVLDGEVISVSVLQAAITGGSIVIGGDHTEAGAETLATQLRSGALPATLTVVSADQVTPEGQAAEAPGGEVEGVEVFTVESAQHTTDPIDYPQTPPVGGNHDPKWQNCGFYDAPVRNENAVHSLEHGAVWIAYHPDLPAAETDALRQLTLVNDRLLVSPYPGLDAPIVLSSWDRQLRLESVDDPRLFAFIDAYSDQAPEPGVTCQGGVGAPA